MSVVVSNIISLFLLSELEGLLQALGRRSNANEDALPNMLQKHYGVVSFLRAKIERRKDWGFFLKKKKVLFQLVLKHEI